MCGDVRTDLCDCNPCGAFCIGEPSESTRSKSRTLLPSRGCTTTGNSTCKMREFTGLNIFLFPLALERLLKVQCDAR